MATPASVSVLAYWTHKVTVDDIEAALIEITELTSNANIPLVSITGGFYLFYYININLDHL